MVKHFLWGEARNVEARTDSYNKITCFFIDVLITDKRVIQAHINDIQRCSILKLEMDYVVIVLLKPPYLFTNFELLKVDEQSNYVGGPHLVA